MPAINTSTATPYSISLYIDPVPANDTVAPSSGVPFMASVTASLIPAAVLIPSFDAGSPWWVMMNRTALPSSETNMSSPR